MVGAMLELARKKPSRTQTRAWVIFMAPLRRKITAMIRSSSTTEMETAIITLLRHAHFAAFGRKCGVAEGSSVRLTCPPNVWFYGRSPGVASGRLEVDQSG